jgi:hypothetical protein
MSTISKWKHKCFDIEAYFRNENRTFLFGPKKNLTKADHFHFGPKSLGRSKTFRIGPKIISGKTKLFYLIQFLTKKRDEFDCWKSSEVSCVYLWIMPGHIVPAQIVHQDEENIGSCSSTQPHSNTEYKSIQLLYFKLQNRMTWTWFENI